MIRFSCPKCRMVLQAAVEQAGATVGCPRCKFQMQVPSAAPVAKVAQQAAGPALDSPGDVRASQGVAQQPPAGAPASAAPAPAPWYFTRDGKKFGPYTAAQLKQYAGSGQLLPTDLLWKEGMEGWRPASTVKGLFAAQQPPPQPAAQAQPSGSHGNPFESLATPDARPLTQAKQQWHRLGPKVKVGIIAGAVAVPVVLVLVVVLVIVGRSGRGGGPVAQDGGDRKANQGTGKPGGGSFAARALQAMGMKERPAHLKPSAPGSTDDFLDALDILGCKPGKSAVSNRKSSETCPDEGIQYVPVKTAIIEGAKWEAVFGKPQHLSDGHDFWNNKDHPFQRWKYVLTDGPITLHGTYISKLNARPEQYMPSCVCMY
jgi:phage FluMu protein Com